jgi:hypothetical protein
MNASAPGWQPDPTGRHEYRYWDGGRWTDDVADAGMTAVDPVPPTDATTVMDPTLGGAPTTAYQPVPGPGAGPGPGGDTFSGAHPPARPPRSGPSTGLLVGLGVLALALVVAIAVVLMGGDDGDDDTATDDIGTSQTTGTTDSDTPGTTTPADDGDDADDTPLDLGTGDLDFDDPEVRDMIVDIVAEQFESSGLTREQAECFTGALLDGMGAERLAEIGESGDMSSITPEDMSSMMDAYTDCGLTDVPLG